MAPIDLATYSRDGDMVDEVHDAGAAGKCGVRAGKTAGTGTKDGYGISRLESGEIEALPRGRLDIA